MSRAASAGSPAGMQAVTADGAGRAGLGEPLCMHQQGLVMEMGGGKLAWARLFEPGRLMAWMQELNPLCLESLRVYA